LIRLATDTTPIAAAAAPMNAAQLSHVLAMHRLLKASYLIMQPFFTNFADRYDVTMNELRIIMTLASGSNAAAHEIGRATGMHPMNVSRAVASLTAAGRISQRPDATIDRRRKIISLTAKGWTLHSRVLPHVKKMAEFMFESMSELEVEFFSKLLRRLNSRLEDIEPSSPLLIDTEAIKAEGAVGGKPGARQKRSRASRRSNSENE
jgi:DNA-binding MarR family transcriptional regulator